MKGIIILMLSSFWLTSSVVSQEKDHPFGLIMEFGITSHNLPENINYRPFLIGGNYTLPLKIINKKLQLNMDLLLLFGVDFGSENNYEFGMNIRVHLDYLFTKSSRMSFKIGTGPYWIDVETARQANGFIFSDYFILSWKTELGNLAFEWSISYRHLSNLSFKQPNGGINNVISGIGIFF